MSTFYSVDCSVILRECYHFRKVMIVASTDHTLQFALQHHSFLVKSRNCYQLNIILFDKWQIQFSHAAPVDGTILWCHISKLSDLWLYVTLQQILNAVSSRIWRLIRNSFKKRSKFDNYRYLLFLVSCSVYNKFRKMLASIANLKSSLRNRHMAIMGKIQGHAPAAPATHSDIMPCDDNTSFKGEQECHATIKRK